MTHDCNQQRSHYIISPSSWKMTETEIRAFSSCPWAVCHLRTHPLTVNPAIQQYKHILPILINIGINDLSVNTDSLLATNHLHITNTVQSKWINAQLLTHARCTTRLVA